MSQKQEYKKPVDLKGQRRKAFKTIMKATADKNKSKTSIFNKLSSVYKSNEGKKNCLNVFNDNPNIPLKVEDEKVKNTV